MMDSAILYIMLFATIAIASTASAQPEGTCQACNCQFNNVEVLSRLIESKIASGELTATVNYNISVHARKSQKFFR